MFTSNWWWSTVVIHIEHSWGKFRIWLMEIEIEPGWNQICSAWVTSNETDFKVVDVNFDWYSVMVGVLNWNRMPVMLESKLNSNNEALEVDGVYWESNGFMFTWFWSWVRDGCCWLCLDNELWPKVFDSKLISFCVDFLKSNRFWMSESKSKNGERIFGIESRRPLPESRCRGSMVIICLRRLVVWCSKDR